MTSQDEVTEDEYSDDPIRRLIDYEQKRVNGLQTKDRKNEDLPQNVHLVKKYRPCFIKVIDFKKYSWYYKKNNKYMKRKTIDSDTQNIDTQKIDTQKIDTKNIDTQNIETQNIDDCIIISDSENEDGDMSLGSRKVKPKIRPVDISSYVKKDRINVNVQNSIPQVSETLKVCVTKEKDTRLNMRIDFKKNQGLIGLKIIKMAIVGKSTASKVGKDSSHKEKGKTSKRDKLGKHKDSNHVKVMTGNSKIVESKNTEKNVTVPGKIINISQNQNRSATNGSNKKSKNNKNSDIENQETKSSEISNDGTLFLRNYMQKNKKTLSSESIKTDLNPEKKHNTIFIDKRCDVKYIKDVWDKGLREAALGTGSTQKLNLNRKEKKSLEIFKEKLKNEKPRNIKESKKCTSDPVKIDKDDNANRNTGELKKTTKERETSTNKTGELVPKKLEKNKNNEKTINFTTIDQQTYQSVIDKDEQMAKSFTANKQLIPRVIYEDKTSTQLPLSVDKKLNPGVIYKDKPLTVLCSAVNKQIKKDVSTSNPTVAQKIIDTNCSQSSIQKQNEDKNVTTNEMIRKVRMPVKYEFYGSSCPKSSPVGDDSSLKHSVKPQETILTVNRKSQVPYSRKDTISMVDNPTDITTSAIAPADSQEIPNEQINKPLQPPVQIMQNNSDNDQNKMLYNSNSDRTDNFTQAVPLIRALEQNMNNTSSIKTKDSLYTTTNINKEDSLETKNVTPSNAPIPNNQLPHHGRIYPDDNSINTENQQIEPYIQCITKNGNLSPGHRSRMKPNSKECLLNQNVIVNNLGTAFNPAQQTEGDNNQVYKYPIQAFVTNRNHHHNVEFAPHANIKNSENLNNIPRGVISCAPIYNGRPQNMSYINQKNWFRLNRPPTQSHKSHPQRQLFHPPHHMPHLPLRMSHASLRMSSTRMPSPQISHQQHQMSYPPQILRSPQSHVLYSQQQLANPSPQMSNPALLRSLSLPLQQISNSPQMYPQQQISNPALQNSQPQREMSYPSQQMANLPPHMSNPLLRKTPPQQQTSHSPQMYPLQQMAEMSNFAQQKSQLQPQVTNPQHDSMFAMDPIFEMSDPSQTSNHVLQISQSHSPMSHLQPQISHLQQQISNSSPKASNPQSGMSHPTPQMLHTQTHMSNPPPQPLSNKLSMKYDQAPPRSVTGSTIIGINDSGVVRKINITAAHVPGLPSPPVVESNSEDVKLVTSKKEMLEELSKVTTLESFAKEDLQSPLHQSSVPTLKRPLPKDDSDTTPIQKPGPLSKKKQYLKSNNGYSPPILPIATFVQTYQRFAEANIVLFDKGNLGPNIELGKTIMTTNKNALRKRRCISFDERQDKSAKKISISEYKKRSTKMDENGMEIDKNITGQNTEQDLGYDSDSTMK